MVDIVKRLSSNKVTSNKINSKVVAVRYFDETKAGLRCVLVDSTIVGLDKEFNKYKVDTIANDVPPKNIYFNEEELRKFIINIFKNRKSIKINDEKLTLAKSRDNASSNEFLICAWSADKDLRKNIKSIDLFVETYDFLSSSKINKDDWYGLDDMEELIKDLLSIFKFK